MWETWNLSKSFGIKWKNICPCVRDSGTLQRLLQGQGLAWDWLGLSSLREEVTNKKRNIRKEMTEVINIMDRKYWIREHGKDVRTLRYKKRNELSRNVLHPGIASPFSQFFLSLNLSISSHWYDLWRRRAMLPKWCDFIMGIAVWISIRHHSWCK